MSMNKKSFYLSIQFVLNVPAGSPNIGMNVPSISGKGDTTKSKVIQGAGGKVFPYISAQSIKRGMREMIIENEDAYNFDNNVRYYDKKTKSWSIAAELSAEEKSEIKQLSTSGNPIQFPDDDLFGYMVTEAPTKPDKNGKPGTTTLTRPAPFTMTPAIALENTKPKEQWSTLSRPGFNPVPYTSEIYRSVLSSTALLHLTSVGTFFVDSPNTVHTNIVEPDNLDELGLSQENVLGQKAVRLPLKQRQQRASIVLDALNNMPLGANAAGNMVSYRPPVVIIAPHRGAQLLFQHVFKSGSQRFTIDLDALNKTLDAHADLLAGPVCLGWDSGFSSDARESFGVQLSANNPHNINFDESRIIMRKFAKFIKTEQAENLFV